MFGSGIVMIALHYLVPMRSIVPPAWRWLGGLVILASVVFAFPAVRLIRKHDTTIRPGEISSALVLEGPYRITRNPMYVGMTFALIGLAILLGSLSPWLVIPLFVVAIDRNIVPVEEALLGQAFGERYAEYCRRVRRWL